MADDDKDPTEVAPKKSKKGVIIMLVAAGLLVAGAAAAGAILAPQLAGGAPPPDASAEPAEPEIITTIRFNPLVVDVRDVEGQIHHLKVNLSGELPPEAVKDEVESFLPRGREQAIAYLRTLRFEEVTAPEKFEPIKKELKERIIKAVGEKRLTRVLVVDFVAQ
jgi:flagellar basal body-associated protein FliL